MSKRLKTLRTTKIKTEPYQTKTSKRPKTLGKPYEKKFQTGKQKRTKSIASKKTAENKVGFLTKNQKENLQQKVSKRQKNKKKTHEKTIQNLLKPIKSY